MFSSTFFVVALFTIQQVSLASSLDLQLYSQVLEMAGNFSLNFTENCLHRFEGPDFEVSRSKFSTDVIILNRTGKKFEESWLGCKKGLFTPHLEPEREILPRSGTMYGMDSFDHSSSSATCTVIYREFDVDDQPTKSEFGLFVDNSENGRNISHFAVNAPLKFEISEDLGNERLAIFILQP